MSQLFRYLFESKIVSKCLNQKPEEIKKVSEAIGLYGKKFDPKNQVLLYRLPKSELHEIASLPCPSEDSISSAKAIRSFVKIDESQTCARCSRICKFRDQPELKAATLTDVLSLINGVYENSDNKISFVNYTSASTLINSTTKLFQDLQQNNGVEFKILMNDLQTQQHQQNQESQITIIKSKEDLIQDDLNQIEFLMSKLEKVKNRSERRRLITEYQQTQLQVWGTHKLFDKVAVQQNQELMMWNPKIRAYVDKELFEDAMKTGDPTSPGYKGISPNYGGGIVEEGKGIGTTRKRMKKLTTVLSKNQKLHSMNQTTPPEFARKINIFNEIERQQQREIAGQKMKFIEENLPVLEAIQEARHVSVYLTTEQDANNFVAEATKLKLSQKYSLGLEDLDECQSDYGENHPVIPSARQISAIAFKAASSILNEGTSYHNKILIEERSSGLKQLEEPIQAKFETLNSLDRQVKSDSNGKFVISKATPIDNRPEKAQANQRRQILSRVINDRYVADNYYKHGDTDEILFEKDGTISKLKQFHYKVHKFIKRNN